jgi:hypothetical protein
MVVIANSAESCFADHGSPSSAFADCLDKNPVPKRLARLLQTPLRRRQGVDPQSRGNASLRVQASGRLRYRRAAPADKHSGAGQAWVRPADHADEADERGAVRIRGP